jgi:glycosyltransferase involved in cell wall biosynthesis
MNIVHIFPEINKGGTERIVLSLARQQAQKNQVSIIVFSNKDLYPNLTDGLTIIKITEPTYIEYSAFGVKKKSLSELTEQLAQLNPDIIHSHSFWTDLLLLFIPKLNAKYIGHFHLYNDLFDVKFVFTKKQITQFLDKRRMIRKYRAYDFNFVSISKDIDQKFKDTFPYDLTNRFHLIPNAIDLPDLNQRKNRELSSNREFVLLNVSRLEPIKNHLFIIKVVQGLVNKGFSDFRLLIAGEGSQRTRIEGEIKSKGLGEKIILLGNVDDIQSAYLEADLYLHSAKKESFGLTFVEALSYGVPCLGVKAGGNEDIIVNGLNGFLVDEQVELFTDTLIKIMTDPTLYNHLASHAVESIQRFDMKNYVLKIELLYRSLLKR